MASLDSKIALVTGGGTGIGRATAEEFITEGAKVVVIGRREEPLKQLAAAYPGHVTYLQADVASSGEAKKVIDFALAEHGRLDVVVNNAAVFLMKPLVETTDEEISAVLNTNIAGVLSLSREALSPLGKTKGNIVNISSTVTSGATPGTSVYAGAKAAVEQITRVLAAEAGALGVRVNAVSPGVTETEMVSGIPDEMRQMVTSQTPLGRIGQPADIAKVVAWLAGPNAGWVTGQRVAASGGLMA